jgi:plastocyanin
VFFMRYAILAAATLLVAAGCGGYGGKSKSSGGGSGGKTTVAGVSANNHGSKSVSGSAEVELYDYYFEPTVLKGKPGSSVTLELKNEGSVEHNFTIDSQGIDKNIQPGKSVMVSVTIPKSGAVSFYCRFHKSRGMAGALSGGGNGGMTGTGSTTGTTTTGTTTGGYGSKGY